MSNPLSYYLVDARISASEKYLSLCISWKSSCILMNKGQLISEAIFSFLQFFQKRTKYLQNFALATRAEVFRSFFGRIENKKICFWDYLTIRSSLISNFNLLFGGKGKKCSFSIPCGIVKNEISLVERLLLCIFYTKKKENTFLLYLLPKVITVIWVWYNSSDILRGIFFQSHNFRCYLKVRKSRIDFFK